jgi:hypothetical protein
MTPGWMAKRPCSTASRTFWGGIGIVSHRGLGFGIWVIKQMGL